MRACRFDVLAVKYAAWLNGFTSVCMTKLDCLDEFAEIRVGVAYRYKGEVLTNFPGQLASVHGCVHAVCPCRVCMSPPYQRTA